MASLDPASVARTLLTRVTEPAAAAVLLASAEVRGDETTLAPLPPEAVEAELSAPVHRTEFAARNCDDPRLLDQLARDSRLSVRRAVAANAHATASTRSWLLAKAYKCNDETSLLRLVRYVPATEMLATRPRTGPFPSQSLAYEVLKEGRRDQLAALLRSPDKELCSAALVECAKGDWGDREGMDFTDALVELDRNPSATFALGKALLQAPHLDEAWAEVLAADLGVWRVAKQNAGGNFTTAVQNNSRAPQTCSAEAFDVLAAAHPSQEFLTWLCGRVLDDDALRAAVDVLVAHPDPEVSAPFLTSNGNRLDTVLAHRLLRAVIDAGQLTSSFAHLAFSKASAALPRDIKVQLAASNVKVVLLPWVAGRWPRHSPTDPDEVAAAVAAVRPGALTQVGTEFSAELAEAEHVDAFADACGEYLHGSLLTNSSVAAYVAARLCRELGADEALWATALALLADWTASIGDLIDATYLTLGRDRGHRGAPPELLAEDADGQLALVMT